MIDKEKINLTFNRIEKSLDLRFQKKGTLFISKDDMESLKKTLYKEEYQNFFALKTKIGEAVLIQVLLKNSWLINDRAFKNKDFKKMLLGNIGKEHFDFLEKIIEDKTFSTKVSKEFFEKIYYELLDVKRCQKIYQDNKIKASVRAICFKRFVMNSSKEGSYLIRETDSLFMDKEFYKYVKNKPYLNNILEKFSEKDKVAEWILTNKCDKNMDTVWSSAFASLKNNAFNATINYINLNMDYDNFTTKWLIRKIIPKLLLQESYSQTTDKVDSYIEEIFNLYSHRGAYRIKVLFLDMLEPSKFKNKDLAFRLLDGFEKRGISESFNNRVEKIRVWEDSSLRYISVNEIMTNLESQDISKKTTLNFISMKLRKTDKRILQELYISSSSQSKIKTILSYSISKDMEKNNSNFVKYFDLTEEYIDVISDYIDEDLIDTPISRDFLYQNEKHHILDKFTRR